jgi:regulatory protein
MIITSIERTARRRGRVDVYGDGERRAELGRALAMAALRPGQVVDAQQLAALAETDARQQAMQLAASMLARRAHSEREIRRRLAHRRFEPAVIDETIGKLAAARLIDDAAFARLWTEARDETSPRGRRLIVQELRQRGVERDIATSAAEPVDDEDAAYRAAERRSRSMAALEYQAFRTRLSSFLQRRGFGWEASRRAVERCWTDLGGSTDADDLAEFIE